MKLLQIILCILLILAACKKADEQQPPRLSVGSTVFSLAKTTLQPLEILVFTINSPTTKKPTEAILGTLPMLVQTIDDTTFAVQIPEAAQAGTYPFTIADGKSSVQVRVQATKPIADPTAYTQAYLQQVGTSLTRLKTLQDTLIARKQLTAQAAADKRAELQQKMTAANQAFMALSPADKRACAQTLAANRTMLDSLNTMLTNLGPVALAGGRLRSDCPTSLEDGAFKCMVRKVTLISILIGNAVYYGWLIYSPVTPFAGVAVGSLGVLAFLVYLEEYKSVFRTVTEMAVTVSSRAVELTNSLVNQPQIYSSQPVVYQLKIWLRNVQETSDIKSTDTDIKEFVTIHRKLIDLFKGQLGRLLNFHLEWPTLREDLVLPKLASRLKITILNNSKVTAKVADFVKGNFKVTFTTGEKTDQKFDYAVSYDYAGQTVSKTITGNTLLTGTSGIDLTDCQIKTSTGTPITAAGEVGQEYIFSLAGTCKFPAGSLFNWSFGDGKAIIDTDISEVKYVYKSPGTYTIKLRILPQIKGADYVTFEKVVQVNELDETSFSCKINGIFYESKKGTDGKKYIQMFSWELDKINNPDVVYTGFISSLYDATKYGNSVYIGVPKTEWLFAPKTYSLSYPKKGDKQSTIIIFGSYLDHNNSFLAQDGKFSVTTYNTALFEASFEFTGLKKYTGEIIKVTEGKIRVKTR